VAGAARSLAALSSPSAVTAGAAAVELHRLCGAAADAGLLVSAAGNAQRESWAAEAAEKRTASTLLLFVAPLQTRAAARRLSIRPRRKPCIAAPLVRWHAAVCVWLLGRAKRTDAEKAAVHQSREWLSPNPSCTRPATCTSIAVRWHTCHTVIVIEWGQSMSTVKDVTAGAGRQTGTAVGSRFLWPAQKEQGCPG
jgi:hypothetical protein